MRDGGKRAPRPDKVTNPGYHATGAVAVLRATDPRRRDREDQVVSITPVGGYSGAGKSIIEAYETSRPPASAGTPDDAGTNGLGDAGERAALAAFFAHRPKLLLTFRRNIISSV